MTESRATLCHFTGRSLLALSLAAPLLGCGKGGSDATCTGKAWPAGCEPICDQPMAGCLLNDALELPSADTTIEAQIMSTQQVSPDSVSSLCFGGGGVGT